MSDDRVQDALAAYLEHLEVGGPQPDTSHLSPEEREQLDELIGLLGESEGIAFGAGDEPQIGVAASSDAGRKLVAALRDTLPPGVRIASDPAATTMGIAGMDVLEGWIVGTFGGRVRVWLLEGDGELEAPDAWLRGLGRVFRLFPDTSAVALVGSDDACLIVQPEDCAPTIEVPRGSLVGRRYRRPVQPVTEALPVFVRELVPYWEPMLHVSEQASRPIEVKPLAQELASRAIDDQAAAGARARKTNPKRVALTALGENEAGRLAALLIDVHEGRAGSDDVEQELRRLASR